MKTMILTGLLALSFGFAQYAHAEFVDGVLVLPTGTKLVPECKLVDLIPTKMGYSVKGLQNRYARAAKAAGGNVVLLTLQRLNQFGGDVMSSSPVYLCPTTDLSVVVELG